MPRRCTPVSGGLAEAAAGWRSKAISSRDRRDPPRQPPPYDASWLPGSSMLWVGFAVAVFALAVGLAFSLNGGDGTGAIDNATAALDTPPATEESAAATDEPVAIMSPEPGSPPPADPVASPAEDEIEPSDVPGPEPLLEGFLRPIEFACVSDFPGHLPGAPREYRNGIHEGLDFYQWASCVPITLGTPVRAAQDGLVARADLLYTDLTQADLDRAAASNYEGEALTDLFRGRQVWIDHGGGVVTRYAHLSGIAAGLREGETVRAGQIIGFVGESGTPESVLAPGTDHHLHFEIRVGESYLSAGLDAAEAQERYLDAFRDLNLAGQSQRDPD